MDGFSFSQFSVFAFKKVVGNLLMPSSGLFILALIAFFLLILGRYRGFKVLAISCFIAAAALAHPWFTLQLLKPLEQAYPSQLKAEPSIKRVVVLGASFLYAENRPPTATLSLHAQARLVEGVRLYRQLVEQGVNASFIVSGHAGSHNPKAASYVNVASEFVQSLGVDKGDIIKLNKPRTTAEEARALHKLLGQERFYLVTSGYHMPRAMALMQTQEVVPVAAPTAIYSLQSSTLMRLPKAKYLILSDIAAHEYLGITWAYLIGNIKQLPELAF